MSEDYAEAADYDDAGHTYCGRCGLDSPGCGCPADPNTWAKMTCPTCGGQWWRDYDSTSTVCLHRQCGAEGSTVIREPMYAPMLPCPDCAQSGYATTLDGIVVGTCSRCAGEGSVTP